VKPRPFPIVFTTPSVTRGLQNAGDIRDKTDHGNGQPEYGQQHINDSSTGGGDPTGPAGDLSAAAAGLSGTLGVGIKEYMNVPWMPLVVDIDAESAGNSLDPASDRREQSGRGFTNNGAAGRTGGNRTGSSGNGGPTTSHPAAAGGMTEDDDQFPYDETVATAVHHRTATGKTGGNGTTAAAGEEIREPVLRPKSRFRMYRMPDGSAANNGAPSPQVNGGGNASSSSATTSDRSFIVHLLPQRLMNMIEQAEKYARMAFSPFVWPAKERTQRALKYFPRSVYILLLYHPGGVKKGEGDYNYFVDFTNRRCRG